jgi:hypothetical protein
MDRRSRWVGVLVGGWATTLAFAMPFSPFRAARAEDPPPVLGGQLPLDPMTPDSPGRTINPSGGTFQRGSGSPGYGMGGANQTAIALSAPAIGGEAVVYYFDTVHQRLLVYQYHGGDRGGVRLLAARHFDMDLKLEEYRDVSEKSREDLKKAYDAAFGRAGGPGKGAADDLPVKKVEINPGK